MPMPPPISRWCSTMPSSPSLSISSIRRSSASSSGASSSNCEPVAVDAGHFQVRQLGGRAIGVERVVEGHAELVGLQAGGDVGMGLGVHVGVDPQRYARGLAHGTGHFVQTMQLRNRFDVEAQDVMRQRQAHFVDALADAGEDHLARIAARRQHAQQLAAGDDVETGALARHQVEDGQVGVGLHGVADQGVAAGAGVGVGGEVGQQRRLRVHIGRGAVLLGDGGKRRALGVQHAIYIGKLRHKDYCWGTGVDRTGAASVLLAGLAGGALGRYSGPGWPQPLNKTVRHRAVMPLTEPINKRNVDFTIKSWIDYRYWSVAWANQNSWRRPRPPSPPSRPRWTV